MSDKERLLEIIKKDALLRGDFTLASGKKSTYYINAKKVILFIVKTPSELSRAGMTEQ